MPTAFIRPLLEFLRTVALQRTRRRTARILSGLDDRTLRDIGLRRGGLASAVDDRVQCRAAARVRSGPRTVNDDAGCDRASRSAEPSAPLRRAWP